MFNLLEIMFWTRDTSLRLRELCNLLQTCIEHGCSASQNNEIRNEYWSQSSSQHPISSIKRGEVWGGRSLKITFWLGKITYLLILSYGPIGSVATILASFGQGSVPIALSNVGCSGGELRLLDCSATYLTSSSCHHGEDAGVRCHIQTGKKKNQIKSHVHMWIV